MLSNFKKRFKTGQKRYRLFYELKTSPVKEIIYSNEFDSTYRRFLYGDTKKTYAYISLISRLKDLAAVV